MFKYQGVHCPHCGKEFKETDQILICPDCGAPYHKACIQELGQCMFQDLHARGESWQPPKTAAEEAEERCDGMASRRCSRCGTLNGPDKLFCEVCGTPLNREDAENPDQPAGNFQQFGGAQQQGPIPGFHQMPYNPYTTPFGGLGADEEIEELPVKDLALYVKENTHYFLPRFKDMVTRKKSANWNWAAFFLDGFYLMYRKMWGWAVAVLAASFVLPLPSLVIFFNAMLYNAGAEMLVSESGLVALDRMSNICYILSLALKLGVAMFSNRLYKDHVFRRVRKLRDEKKDAPDYSAILTAKGGVSRLAVILCIAVVLIVSMFMSFTMVSAVMKLY